MITRVLCIMMRVYDLILSKYMWLFTKKEENVQMTILPPRMLLEIQNLVYNSMFSGSLEIKLNIPTYLEDETSDIF